MTKALENMYKQKITSANNAILHINQGANIYVGAFCSEPQKLVAELVNQKERLKGSTLYLNLGGSPLKYAAQDCVDFFNYRAFLSSFQLAKLTRNKNVDYIPINLSDISRYYEENKIDVALIQVSPPNDEGYLSLGINVEASLTLIKEADLVIAEVNKQMPFTLGNSLVHFSEIDFIVESSNPLLEIRQAEISDVEREIGKHVAKLIPDGATLQWGIGNVPASVLSSLFDKKDLGVHTGSITDNAIDLIENGNITNRLKEYKRGISVCTLLLGTEKLYKYVEKNKFIEFHPVSITHNPIVISQISNFYSINSAIEIDVFGHINSEFINGQTVAGVGGQMDFLRSAKLSKGGRSIIALSSTTPDESISKISLSVERITSPKSEVDYVVTEYGIAKLFGKSLKQRVQEMISIAHPKFRNELQNQYELMYKG